MTMARTGIVSRLAVARFLRKTPVWLRIAFAVASIALGAVVFLRPTTALDALAILVGAGMVLTGIIDLIEMPDISGLSKPRRIARLALPVGWIVLGIVVFAWPGLTVRALAVITGILLIVNGAAGLGSALLPNRAWDERVSDAAFGLTGIIFGILALGWPDITLLVVAIVFGAWLIIRGLTELWKSVRALLRRGATSDDEREDRPHRVRWGRLVGAGLSVAVAVAAVIVTAPLRESVTSVGEFYTAPRSVPNEPGQLLRAEPFTREVPQDAEGWRILYTTTGLDGKIRVASGLVVVPTGGDPDRPWPVIDWDHGTTGYARHCAPSAQERPFWSGGLYPVKKLIAEGWAIVATDYIGLGTEGPHPYLLGPASAYASLDAVRAARQLDEANLGPSTVVWGHSQGGGAALWTGALAREYAPDVWIRGVAAFAAASDPPALVDHVSDVTGGLVFASYAFEAFSDIYPDITYARYIRPGLQPVMRAMSERCLTDPDMALSILAVVGTSIDPELFSTDPSYGPLGTHLRENVAPTTIGPPLFLGQGGGDSIIPIATQDAYAQRVCDAGQRIDYRRYAGYEHAEVMENYSPMVKDAIEWTKARFASEYEASAPRCSTTDVPR